MSKLFLFINDVSNFVESDNSFQISGEHFLFFFFLAVHNVTALNMMYFKFISALSMFLPSLSQILNSIKQSSKQFICTVSWFLWCNYPNVADFKLPVYDMEPRVGKRQAVYLQDVNSFKSTENNKIWKK